MLCGFTAAGQWLYLPLPHGGLSLPACLVVIIKSYLINASLLYGTLYGTSACGGGQDPDFGPEITRTFVEAVIALKSVVRPVTLLLV